MYFAIIHLNNTGKESKPPPIYAIDTLPSEENPERFRPSLSFKEVFKCK